MENKKIIVGNMKMNLTFNSIKEYISDMKEYKDIVICPSAIYIPYFIDEGFNVGLQNVSEYSVGTYTGEISVTQASSIGIKYALVGHSERRQHFNESDEVINRKLRKIISNDIYAIVCIGETIDEKNNGLTKSSIEKQIKIDLDKLESEYYKNIIIAYEPIWAIGTGNIPSNEDISDISKFIKETINRLYDFEPKVLYGGSTNENNINELNKINEIDGFLIGGACLIPEKFKKIIETVN